MDIKNILSGSGPYAQSKVDRGETSGAAEAAKAKARAKIEASSSGDRVSVSADAKLVAEAAREALESPDVRVDRVESLRQQVQSGNYKPNARQIAAKMVENDLEFLR